MDGNWDSTPYTPYPLNRLRDWLHRWRNWIRIALLVVAGVWLGPPAYRLWNLAGPSGTTNPLLAAGLNLDPGLNIPPPGVDHTKEILAAMASLPTAPSAGPTATPAPAGQRWVTWGEYDRLQGRTGNAPNASTAPGVSFQFDPTEALGGPWLESRFHLQQIVKYLELPGTRTALDTIINSSNQPHCLMNSKLNPAPNFSEIRGIEKLLTARARYHLVAQHDYSAAADDIQAARRLAASLEDDGTILCFLVGMACRCLSCSEVMNWCSEELLTPAEARDLLARFDLNAFDGMAALQTAVAGEQRSVMCLLDNGYVPGEHGRSVLHSPSSRAGDWLVRSLNLLSPLLYDRSEAARWIHRVNTLHGVAHTTRAQRALIESIDYAFSQDPLFPFARYYGGSGGRLSVIAMYAEAEESATRIALALARFKIAEGHYPTRLEELVPTYSVTLPMDPFSREPLRYHVESNGTFVLYTVYENEQDDGGDTHFDPANLRGDRVLSSQRGQPSEEWVLVPIAQATQPTSQAASDR